MSVTTHQSELLLQYERIAGLSGQMLAAAKAQRWDDVITLGDQYCEAVERLKQYGDLDMPDRVARKPLLDKILEDDAHIRMLAAPELRRLGGLLGDLRRQYMVMQAYTPSADT